MKINKRTTLNLAIVLVAIGLFLAPTSDAQQVGEANGTVCKTGTLYDTNELKYSIRRFVNYFNKDLTKQACRDTIEIQHDIVLEQPLVLSGPSTAGKSLTIGTGPTAKTVKYGLVIEGNGHTIDISKITNTCAIRVKTANVLIRNLFLLGDQSVTAVTGAQPQQPTGGEPPASGSGADGQPQQPVAPTQNLGAAGICLEGPDNSLDHVVVSYVKGKGIIVSSEGNVVGEGSGAYRNADIGLHVMKSAVVQGDPLAADPNIQIFNDVDPHLILFGNGAGTSSKQFFVDDAKFDVKMAGSGGDGEYQIYGFVTINGYQKAPYLMVFYSVQPNLDIDPTNLKVSDVALGYLALESTPTTNLPTGLTRLTDGTLDESGYFDFSLTQAQENSSIFVVVYPYKDVVGGSTKTYLMSGFQWGDVNEAGAGFGIPGTTGGTQGSAVDYDQTHLYSQAACLKLKGPNKTTPVPGIYDSDDDGIPDYLEDASFNCMSDKPAETDLRNADSDNDGIPDGREDLNQNGFVDCYMPITDPVCVNKQTQGSGLPQYGEFTDDATGDVFCLVEPAYQKKKTGTVILPTTGKYPIPDPTSMVNGVPNGFKKSVGFCLETNPRSAESDGDGKKDGEEDRSGAFRAYLADGKTAQGSYYFYMTSSGSGQIGETPAVDVNGDPLTCTLVSKEKRELGVQYFFGITDPAAAAQSVEQPLPGQPLPVKKVNLVCKNETVLVTDFNGIYDSGFGESDPKKADTDGDGLCDGNGCTNMVNITGTNDLCPEVDEPSCKSQCYPGKLIDDLPAGYDYSQVMAELKKIGTPEENMAQKSVLNALGGTGLVDSDGDGIPDIIESDSGMSCGAGVLGYHPFKADTDDDTIVDDTDACVADAVATCVAAPIQYNTKPAPILACYVDRDGDGLYDCQEDINLDGKIDEAKGETSPSSKDTDGDGIEDYIENQYGLKANKVDSDDDGIPDAIEIQRGDPNKYDAATSLPQSCAEAVVPAGPLAQASGFAFESTQDTNPMDDDTDDDGIKDGQELKNGTSPVNPDSDQDGLCDGDKAVAGICEAGEDFRGDGLYPYFEDKNGDGINDDPKTLSQGDPGESNPCDPDTDHHGFTDMSDKCKNIPDESCDEPNAMGHDSDSDGIPDATEIQFTGTDPFEKDSDGDGLIDGCTVVDGKAVLGTGELCNQVAAKHFYSGFSQLNVFNCGGVPYLECDTDPKNVDTDNDGVTDKIERIAQINPIERDTDQDCITDGDELRDYKEISPGVYDPIPDSISGILGTCSPQGAGRSCTKLNPNDPDTDGDGLPDGDGNGSGYGEDLDCNGLLNKTAEGLPIETSPLTWDTDHDGVGDFEEMTAYVGFNVAYNISRATSGRARGCTLIIDE